MEPALTGKQVAFLVTDGFEQAELLEPRRTLEDAGALVKLVSPKQALVQGFQYDVRWDRFHVDIPLERAHAADYDALVLPGGIRNADSLRTERQALEFVRAFLRANKPVAAIGRGLWLLIEADVLRGRTVTSWPSIKTDLIRSGAHWVDEEVVVDGNLITSRKSADLPAFNQKLLRVVAQTRTRPRHVVSLHQGQ